MDIDAESPTIFEADTQCLSPASFWAPIHLRKSAWHEHAPFAFWLTQAAQPRCLVELGTADGFSYLAFCQAVHQLALQTSCYAIDTWKGDEHAGFYGEDVFSSLSSINDRDYSTFSRLIRARFDDALPYISDQSIDLLHIDGRHGYDDVRHDFETWRPKLSERGIILFHDTNVRERGFGVWRLWQELVTQHPSFQFYHGHGLGVLAPCQSIPPGLASLFRFDRLQQVGIRSAYARLGAAVRTQYELERARVDDADTKQQLMTVAAAAKAEATAAKAEAVEACSSAAAVTSAALAEQARLEAAAVAAERQRKTLTAEVEWARQYLATAAAAVAEQARLAAEARAAQASQATALAERDAVLNSTIWRATWPLRRAGAAMPVTMRRSTRRLLRAGHWVITGQFGRRVEQWRSARAGAALRLDQPQPTEASPTVTAELPVEAEYDRWIRQCDTLTNDDRAKIRAHIAQFAERPLISVVIPAYKTPERLLREAIASVQAQLYSHWELCIADDASPSDGVVQVLRKAAADDPRIKWMRRDQNGHIAAATNSALAMATGEFVVLMDHDDLLPEQALYEIVSELNLHPDTDILYSDEDQIDDMGRRSRPYFKPDWNIELMLGHNLISHLGAYRRTLVEEVGGMRPGYEGSQDYDLALRTVAATSPARIRHIPAILYHWRQHTTSFSKARENACVDAARRAIRDYLVSQGITGFEVTSSPAIPAWTRVRWPLPNPLPKVSVIIPTRDKAELLVRSAAAVLLRTDYPDLELVIADNDTTDPEASFLIRKLAEDPRVRVLPCGGPFNYSAINNAAAQAATGEVLVLLNNDIDTIHTDWLREMVSLVVRPGVGAVGAKLIYGNETIQHAGVVLGTGSFYDKPGVAGHYGLDLPAKDVGYFGYIAMAHEVAAVTGACLAIRRSVFEQVDGLDAINLEVSFNDIDFCLRLREAGFRNVWTPFAELYHLESASRGSDLDPDKIKRFTREVNYMRQRWGTVLDSDPFYNTNFSRADHSFHLAIPARRKAPWHQHAESGETYCPPKPKSCSRQCLAEGEL